MKVKAILIGAIGIILLFGILLTPKLKTILKTTPSDEFIQLMMDNENYKEFKTKKKLEPFYRLRQPITFVKHVFETLEETDIYEYLKCSWHLDTEEDSEKFQRLICEDRYIKFIESSEMYNIVSRFLEL